MSPRLALRKHLNAYILDMLTFFNLKLKLRLHLEFIPEDAQPWTLNRPSTTRLEFLALLCLQML